MLPQGMRLGPRDFPSFIKALLSSNTDSVGVKKMKENPFLEDGRSLVSFSRRDDVFSSVQESVNLLGGLEKLGLKGKKVLVKPNVNSDDPFPGTTNPEVVRSVVRLLIEAGAGEVVVADQSNSFYLPTLKTMQKLGIKQAAEEEGAVVDSFENHSWVRIEDSRLKNLGGSVRVSELAYTADLIVSVPVVKTHSLETFTMSLKNWVGIIHPKDRYRMHAHEDVAELMIPEINLCVHPDLIIMDGTVCMVQGGPFSGTERELNLIISSGDRIANDLAGLGVISHFGLWSRVSDKLLWEQDQIRRAVELGLGAARPDEIKLLFSPESDKELSALVDEVRERIKKV